ncbi:MAG: aldo/keto reductase [Eubacteriales bacterium]|nr:aldo/keto reductase [Eubacteriales bacterium]
MQYRNDRYGNPISLLGYGCMRFTKNAGAVDLDKAEKEVMTAIAGGVNYFDTAYVYAGNEVAVGRIFARNHVREKVNLATKLPHYLISSRAGMETKFQEELSRLQTDYIDYYLMHMLTDIASWEKLRRLGVEDWIREKKESGQIRQIGFSFHGGTDMFLQILDAYDWDFCQIQYNYMDEHSQAGVRGLKAAAAKGIPVIIMEGLRGGRLVNMLPETARSLIAADGHGYSAAEWGLRWLYNQSEVTCVLSGMNSLAMVEENLRIASGAAAGEFGEKEFALIDKIRREIDRNLRVPCTGCGYCMPCPHGVNIPGTFRCYNEMYAEDKRSGRTDYFRSTLLRHSPTGASQCVGCGACERHCPQAIPIRARLKEAGRELETPVYKAAGLFLKAFPMW